MLRNTHISCLVKPLNPELNPICYLLALLAHHFFHVSRIRVKSLNIRLLMSYIYDISNLRVNTNFIIQEFKLEKNAVQKHFLSCMHARCFVSVESGTVRTENVCVGVQSSQHTKTNCME